MPTREFIQDTLGEAYADPDMLQQAVFPFVGKHVTEGVYDPVNETYTGETITYHGRGVFDEFAQDRIDGINILTTDTNLIILANEVDREPAEGDTINGERIMRVIKDPMTAHYEVQLRGDSNGDRS